MRALIVASDPERQRALRMPLEAAGTDCAVVETWAAANPRLVAAERPALVVADFELLVHDGLNSLLAADAQLKVLRIPSVLVYDQTHGRDVAAVRALVHFARSVELPSNDLELTRAFNALVPGVAAVTPTAAPLQSVAADLGRDGGLAAALEAAATDSALPPGTRVHGRYEIERLVETGGMGQIYRARQLPLGRPVALKVIRSDLARESDAVARFQLEARTVSRLTHPNTIVLFDYGIDPTPHPGRHVGDELMYLAMEWLEGQTLEQLLQRDGPLPPARAVHIAAQVAQSLAEAHDKAIVHRDLKPSNIFVLAGDFVKVLDFGIAKIVDTPQNQAITRVGAICGTPEYMSPEQARGEELDGRSDLYALGCVLYIMLTGAPPFVHEQPLQVIIAHQTLPPPPLLAPELPALLADTVAKLMAKKREQRLSSATVLAEILELLDRGQEHLARDRLAAATGAHGLFSGAASTAHRVARATTVSASTPDALLDDEPDPDATSIDALFGPPPTDALDDLDLLGASDPRAPDPGDDDDDDDDDEFELLDPFSGDAQATEAAPQRTAAPAAAAPASAEEFRIEWPELAFGQLAELAMPRWLHLASRRRLSGTLTVTRNRLNQSAQLRNGQLVRTPGTRLESLLGTFAWTDGEYHFVETPVPGEGEAVEMLPFIFEGIRLHTSVNSVASELARANDRHPVTTTLWRDQAAAFAALEGISALAALCDGQRTVGELMMSAGLGFESVCRGLTLLMATDAVRLVEAPTRAPLPVRYGRKGETNQLARPATSLAPADQLLYARIERFLEQFAAGRLHEAFDLERGCGPDAVHDAYARFVRDYSESRLRRKPGTIGALSATLHERARAAFRQLLEQEEPAPLSASEQQVLDRLEAARAQFASPDAYAVFGLARGCGSAAVDDVYFKLVNQHHPDHFAAHTRPELKRAANDAFIALQEVYQRLLASEPQREPTTTPAAAAARPQTGVVAVPVSAASPAAVRSSGSVSTVARVGRPVSAPAPSAATVVPSSPAASRPATRGSTPASSAAPSAPTTATRTSGPVSTVARMTSPTSGVAAMVESGPSPTVARMSPPAGAAAEPVPTPPAARAAAPATPAPPPAAASTEPQTSRYRIAPPARPARPPVAERSAAPSPAPRPTSGAATAPAAGSVTPRAGGSSSTAPASSARPTPGAGATGRAPAAASGAGEGESGAPRQRKMSEILAERAARQAAAAGPTPSGESASAVAAAVPVGAGSFPGSTRPGGPSPEESFRAGERFLARQQHDRALAAFEAAAAALPENGRYVAYLAWTRHVCDSSSAEDTQNILKNARRLDEGYVAATYFLGKLALLQQDLSAARGYFEGVLAKSPRHVDAQRELRLVKMRLEEASQGGLLDRLKRKLRGDS